MATGDLKFRSVIAGGASLYALVGACNVYAQANDDDVIESVVVTATGTNISGVKPVGSEAVTMSAEAIRDTGVANIVDAVRTLPQVQSLNAERDGGNTGVNSTQSSAISLRGLGRASTLLLIDGRRVVPSGSNTTFLEANQVPMAALERIEVIADGASAIYGSDAIAGVVNYVMRKDYEGLELSGRYQTSSYNDESGFSALLGKSWQLGNMGQGNVLVAVEYNKRDPMIGGESPYLRADLRPLGGADGRINGATATPGIPGNIVVPRSGVNPTIPRAGNFDYYGLPAGTNGVGLSAADLLYNQPNLVDTSRYTDFMSELDRRQASIFVTQALTPNVEFYLQGFYTDRTTTSQTYPTNANIMLPASSPYYIAGIPGVAPGQALRVQYNFSEAMGDQSRFENTSETYTISTGLKYGLPIDGWNGETYFTMGNDESCGLCFRSVNTTAFQALVTAGVANPLTSEPLPADVVAQFTGGRVQHAWNRMYDVVTKANGPLFDLPAGPVRGAIGGEYSDVTLKYENFVWEGANNQFVNNVPYTETPRDVKSAFAELYIPVVGPDSNIPFMRELNFSAAVRYDDYSDFGSTSNPKFGFTWDLTDGFALRGSWGTSFRAPGLAEKSPNVTSLINGLTVTNNSGDPNLPIDNPSTNAMQALVLRGANGELSAETADVWSVGFDWTPEFLPDLNISATYYDIHWTDQLVYQDFSQMLLSPANRQLYGSGGYITPTPQPASCVHGDPSTYNPAMLPFLSMPNLSGQWPEDLCELNVVLDARASNAAQTYQSGIDLQADYTIRSGVGDLRLHTAVTHVLRASQNLVPDTPLVDIRDRINTSSVTTYPVTWRGNAGVTWRQGGWSAGLTGYYTGSYTNDVPAIVDGVRLPVSTVDSWLTWDVRLGYSVDDSSPWDWAHGVRAALVVINATDEDPPLALTSIGTQGAAGGSFDFNHANPFGRILTFQLSKAFN